MEYVVEEHLSQLFFDLYLKENQQLYGELKYLQHKIPESSWIELNERHLYTIKNIR
jgi:hypothetical protein